MNKRTTILLALCLLLIASLAPTTTTAAAAPVLDTPPPLPQAFYGSVEVNGQPAPVGAKIEARGDNVLVDVPGNPLVITVAGQYGGPTRDEAKLIVQGQLQDDQPLEFYVDGAKAQVQKAGEETWQDSYPYIQGVVVTHLNLRVTIKRLYLPFVLR